ncbi:MAG: hypothetical protein VKL59_24335 [Nostocaceae cyanobacterium]|nr:hypothetical protein [Nostocaceae cyanobacterium]
MFREIDLLFLVIYVIVVLYTFNRMVESIDDQIKITFDKGAVDDQLQQQQIPEKVGIAFKLKGQYDFDHPKELDINIENKTKTETILINWDECSLVGYDGRSRRVIRLTPNIIRDLGQPQVDSAIAPGKTLQERVTAEDVLVRNEGGIYNPSKTLIDISKLKKVPKLFASFEDRNLALKFSLRLDISVSERTGGTVGASKHYSIDCPFTVTKLPWTYALPQIGWNKKKK